MHAKANPKVFGIFRTYILMNRELNVRRAGRQLYLMRGNSFDAVWAGSRVLFDEVLHRDFHAFMYRRDVTVDLDISRQLIPKVQADEALFDVKILAGREANVARVVELSAGDLIAIERLADGLRENPADDASNDLDQLNLRAKRAVQSADCGVRAAVDHDNVGLELGRDAGGADVAGDGAGDADWNRVEDATVAVTVIAVFALAAVAFLVVFASRRRMTLKSTAGGAGQSLSYFFNVSDVVWLFNILAFCQSSDAIQPATGLSVVRGLRQVTDSVSSRSFQADIATVRCDETGTCADVGQAGVAVLRLNPLQPSLRIQKLDVGLVVVRRDRDLESVELVVARTTFWCAPLGNFAVRHDEQGSGPEVGRIRERSANNARSSVQQSVVSRLIIRNLAASISVGRVDVRVERAD